MSEGIALEAFTYRSPRRRIQKLGLYAQIANRLASRRERDDDERDASSTLGRIFTVGRYAVNKARTQALKRPRVYGAA